MLQASLSILSALRHIEAYNQQLQNTIFKAVNWKKYLRTSLYCSSILLVVMDLSFRYLFINNTIYNYIHLRTQFWSVEMLTTKIAWFFERWRNNWDLNRYVSSAERWLSIDTTSWELFYRSSATICGKQSVVYHPALTMLGSSSAMASVCHKRG